MYTLLGTLILYYIIENLSIGLGHIRINFLF